MKLSPDPRPFRLSLGDRGELLACDFLVKNGYRILEKNYKCALGEIDVVAKKKERTVFIEIKTRTGRKFGLPQEAVDARKQDKLLRLAEWYLKEKKMANTPTAFDVVAVTWEKGEPPQITLIENAFEKKDEVR